MSKMGFFLAKLGKDKTNYLPKSNPYFLTLIISLLKPKLLITNI